jgi:hypothetical protein
MLLIYGTSKPSSLVDLNSWTKWYPIDGDIGGGVVAWNLYWGQARRGGQYGGANLSVGKLGLGFVSSSQKVATYGLRETHMWRVARM